MGIVLRSPRTWKCAAEYNMERPLSRILNVCFGVNSVEKLTVGMIFSSQQFLETMFLSGYCPFFY